MVSEIYSTVVAGLNCVNSVFNNSLWTIYQPFSIDSRNTVRFHAICRSLRVAVSTHRAYNGTVPTTARQLRI